jgi:tRNA(Ile2) C34 agmatinyltransferase TiaS
MGVYFGTVIFVVLAVLVVVLGLRQFNRPKCPSCGLSVGRDQQRCPYCHAAMRG